MGNLWYKFLVYFSNDTIWSKKNLLHKVKDEKIIDDAIKLGYIEECGSTDINEPQYRITTLGKKIRDN